MKELRDICVTVKVVRSLAVPSPCLGADCGGFSSPPDFLPQTFFTITTTDGRYPGAQLSGLSAIVKFM